MSLIFISHSERDFDIAREIADGLEAAGYRAFYFERDILPGASYVTQLLSALDSCEAVVLLISPRSVDSDQITKEVVHAFETRKPFFPVLCEMGHSEFQRSQPE